MDGGVTWGRNDLPSSRVNTTDMEEPVMDVFVITMEEAGHGQ
jgi:hypothetical protein